MNSDQSLEMGKLYADRGDYTQALPYLYQATELFLADKNYPQYFKAVQQTLRIYAEREDFEQLSAFKEKLHDIVIRENIEISSRAYYSFGAASLYKGQIDSAVEYYKLALDQALKSNDKEDTCYAILGIAICLKFQKKYDDALKEIYNLNIFLQFIENIDLKASVLSTNALILMDLKKYDQALDILWSAYELTKFSKNLNVASGILVNIGICLCELGQKEVGLIYFNLVKKTNDPQNAKYFYRSIAAYDHMFANQKSNDFDLSFDFQNHQIIERKIGKIDFKNQFILLDLLKLFITHQGEVFSKEYLVEHVWKQVYNPEIHDNKIYVTIKRLRKLIEPDFDQPKYIFRSKNGYFLNKAVKVQNLISNRGEI